MEYVKALAHLQTSKFKDNGDMDSDSDSDIENAEDVDEEPTQVNAVEEQNHVAESQSDISCKICLSTDVNATVPRPCLTLIQQVVISIIIRPS